MIYVFVDAGICFFQDTSWERCNYQQVSSYIFFFESDSWKQKEVVILLI